MNHRMFVGLGNPGPNYLTTRHNAGFLLVDRLVAHFDAVEVGENEKYRLWSADWRDIQVFLMKPSTYMNLSGHALASFLRSIPMTFQDILIAYDDVALPLGCIRVRPSGSAGGQKGMSHIIETLGSSAIPRLRIGIRSAGIETRPLSDFVLDDFEEAELPVFHESLAQATDAGLHWLTDEMGSVMGRFNRKQLSSDDEGPGPHTNTEESVG